MPITLNTLRAAANLGADRLQTQDNQTLRADTRKNWFFNFATVRAINKDKQYAAEQIKQALGKAYGLSRIEKLYKEHVGDTSKGISSIQLKALLKLGDIHVSQSASRDLVGQSLGALNLFLQYPVISPTAPSDMQPIIQLRSTLCRAMVKGTDVLGIDPLNQPELYLAMKDVQAAKAELQTLSKDITGIMKSIISPTMLGTCQRAIAELEHRLTQKEAVLQKRLQSCPTTNDNVEKALFLMHEALRSMASELLSQIKNVSDMDKVHKLLDEIVQSEKIKISYNADKYANADAKILKKITKMPDNISNAFFKGIKKIQFDVDGKFRTLSSNEIEIRLQSAHCRVLNHQHWQTIQNTTTLTHGTESKKFTTVIRPATAMSETLRQTYRGNGVCCHATAEATHAVNMAETGIDFAGNTAKPLFTGIRHGVHCAYGISNHDQRQRANDVRVREMLVAALEQKLQREPGLWASIHSQQTIPLPITSVSLLTPDIFRKGADNHERRFLREQTSAWHRASSQPQQLSIQNAQGSTVTVTVQPQVLTFNFGVNAGAQEVYQDVGGGWGLSESMNRQAIRALLGASTSAPSLYSSFLASPHVDAQTKAQAKVLAEQIIESFHYAAYRETGENPYNLPARILLLCHLMDVVPAFNCKSGKDRTGQLDVEVKTLAASMALLHRLPEATQLYEDDEYQDIRESMSVNGGNHEMQRLNTGLAGFKTKGVIGLDALYHASAHKTMLGLSEYVHS